MVGQNMLDFFCPNSTYEIRYCILFVHCIQVCFQFILENLVASGKNAYSIMNMAQNQNHRFCRSDGPLPRAISNSIFQIIVREILVSRSRFSPSFFLVEFGRALTLPCRAACHSNHANHRIARYKYRRNLPTGSFRAWHVATAVTRRESAIFSDSNFAPLMGSVFDGLGQRI